MKQRTLSASWLSALWCVAFYFPATTGAAANNFKLHGALVAEPCTLQEADLELDFGTVVDKELYTHQRTGGKSLQITLQDCDLSLGKSVRISFGGQANLALPGLLALDAGSAAQGVAIGFETLQGQPLPLNDWSSDKILTSGHNLIALQAYIRAEPEAIAQKTITLGTLSAITTFTLRYE
ncbi:fimbrial protein [Serratia nevei]|uniref:fimbrial protein n=1 Tax=Serratia TaxID=613 RepID=UPI00313C9361